MAVSDDEAPLIYVHTEVVNINECGCLSHHQVILHHVDVLLALWAFVFSTVQPLLNAGPTVGVATVNQDSLQ